MTQDTVQLQKGENVSLTKQAGGTLNAVEVELGWDPPNTDGAAFDLDALVLELGTDRKVINQGGFVFYSSRYRTADKGATVYYIAAPTSPYGKDLPTDALGAVVHHGDTLTGAGNAADDPDESISIDLTKVDPACQAILFVVDIYNGPSKGQKFGQVVSSFIRIKDAATGNVLARYDLTEDASTETCMIFGEMYRNDGGWKFKSIEAGYSDGMAALATAFGVGIGPA
jgi:tellurium resistance protein TerD